MNRVADRLSKARRAAMLLPTADEEISEEAMLRQEKQKRIGEYVRTKPEEASRLLKVWLAE
jgi:flagellar biosynthesis/type III secretory pathway M-ring protein FliF/YscJ